jgi:hypothetical protein
MSSLAEIDRDLDSVQVDPARLEAVRQGAQARAITLAAADEELAALGVAAPRAQGVGPSARVEARPRTQPPPRPATEPPPTRAKTEPPISTDADVEVSAGSGVIDVPDEVLRHSNLPPVLALDASAPAPETAAEAAPAPPPEPLALDLEPGESGLADAPELPASHTAVSIPFASAQPIRPPTQPPPPMPVEAAAPADDPGADLADLLGDADPMREDEGAAPLAPAVEDLEPESTTMFSAEDAERFSRPIDALLGDGPSGDVELDLDEMVEIDDLEMAEEEPAPVAARAPTAPPPPRTAPPPPRTAPPPPPTHPPDGPRPEGSQRGFLGKLLQRKPGS